MILILGGGIIGLATGWYLAQAGADVTVLEKQDKLPKNATWASGGVIAPWSYESPGIEPLIPFQRAGRAAWPSFAEALAEATGTDIDYVDNGLLHVALSDEGLADLNHLLAFQERVGVPFERLTGKEARQIEPNLSETIIAGALMADNHQVDNRKVSEALTAASVASGGQIRRGSQVDEVVISNGRVTGVRVGDEKLEAETVVLAAGAWSQGIAGLPPAVRPPVFPLKGQMLTVQMDPAQPLTRQKILGLSTYLMPRTDGRLLIGATVEDVGFDET
ncbi:MAG: FAD-dependent oxidoreductase, partial [Chloroflexota bacterium]